MKFAQDIILKPVVTEHSMDIIAGAVSKHRAIG